MFLVQLAESFGCDPQRRDYRSKITFVSAPRKSRGGLLGLPLVEDIEH